MMRFFILYLFLFSSYAYAISHKVLCFSSNIDNNFCNNYKSTTIILDKNVKVDEHVFTIQKSIRTQSKQKNQRLILIAENFDASLLFVAQGNMHQYYRKSIKGLVLKNAETNYFHICQNLTSTDDNSTCLMLQDFNMQLNKKASYTEVLKALSPAYQIDLYTPKCVLIDKNTTRVKRWEKIFKENSTEYINSKDKQLSINKWFPEKISTKIQPKETTKEPNYFGVLFRYHLGKISYVPKHELVEKKEISYASHKLQKYDVFYKQSSIKNNSDIKNPLLIYVHGGGWTSGDKVNFNALCQQYADKGFTAISINYRLLDLPKVGMNEMVEDVTMAIQHIFNNAKEYHIDLNNTVIMADSAGAQLAYMATVKLTKSHQIKLAIYNSITSDLSKHSKVKQIRLSGIEDDKKRALWLDAYSPLKNLQFYKTNTLAIHSLDDQVVPMTHLETLEIYSVINYNNIESLWIKNASHPISSKIGGMQPSYDEIEEIVQKFIKINKKPSFSRNEQHH